MVSLGLEVSLGVMKKQLCNLGDHLLRDCMCLRKFLRAKS